MENSYFKHKVRNKQFGLIAGWIIIGIIAVTGFAFLFGYVVMLLWNWLMSDILDLPEIAYWQAVGIIILAKLLFGGFGHNKHSKNEKCEENSKHFKAKGLKSGFSRWKYYDKFWKDEGKEAFSKYAEKQNYSDEDNIEEVKT